MRRNSKREKGRERGGKEGEDWKKRNKGKGNECVWCSARHPVQEHAMLVFVVGDSNVMYPFVR